MHPWHCSTQLVVFGTFYDTHKHSSRCRQSKLLVQFVRPSSFSMVLLLIPHSGDSYTQTQFSPSGILPSIGNALGNPPYPVSRFGATSAPRINTEIMIKGFTAVGGTNWIDVDTVVFNKSLIFTYNYAYGGATIDASLVTPYEPTVLSMTDQVNQFLTTVANKPASTPWTSSNALFSFFIGINDIGNSYYQSGSRDA